MNIGRPSSAPSGAPHQRGLSYRRRVGGLMLMACGVLGVGVVLLPDSDSTTPLLICSALAAAFGVMLTCWPRLAPSWTSQAMIGLITVLISVAAAATDPNVTGRVADVQVFYVLVAVYAFYFFRARAGFGQVALAGVGYAAVLWHETTLATGVSRWVTTMVAMVVAGLMVRAMNREVDSLVDELDATAARDPLTATLNRRGLAERLGIELTRARRAHEPLTVLAADLDGLKTVNDEHGHAAGDEALLLTADVLAGALRDVDVLARIGGDEFLVLLPNCDTDDGVRRAEELREAVFKASRNESWPVSLSIGVATCPPLPLDPDAVTGAADSALYRAKALGRNQVARAGRNEVRDALRGS